MRTVAIAAAALGADVDGCDREATGDDGELERHKIRIRQGHATSHIRGRRLVATTVIRPDHPELRAAQVEGVAHHRADLLAALLRDRRSIAVTGTHGKGTVAALTGVGLVELGADPLLLLGLTVPELGGSVRVGRGPAVAEADESDGTIARIVVDISVVTNVWFDHPQYRRPLRETLAALAEHVAAVPPNGRVILGRERRARSLEACARAPVWRLGRDFEARIVETDSQCARMRFADPEGGVVDGTLRLRSVFAEDSAAFAYAALRASGYSPELAAAALARPEHLARRFQIVGTAHGVTVVADFGKHPRCIRATMDALRRLAPRRVLIVYEPNRYDHVSRWGSHLARAFSRADRVVVLPIDDRDFGPARRVPADWFRRFGLDAELAADHPDAIQRLRRHSRPGDIICVLGVHDHLARLAHGLLAALDGDPCSTGAPLR